MAVDEGLVPAYRHCEDLVRETDRDRWLASLFLPQAARPHVLALLAFSGEIARVRETVRDPMPGEIRLQWWRDVLAGAAHGDVAGHPVAAALVDTITRFGLPTAPLLGLIDARTFDLYDDPMPTLNDLEGYAGETVSALIQATCLVLCDGRDPRSADAAGHAGVAWAMTGLMRALPIQARRGQCFLPEDVLARHLASAENVRDTEATDGVRAALAELREHAGFHRDRALAALDRADRACRPAFVNLGLVPAYLKALAKAEPFESPATIAPWRKPLLLWWQARRLDRSGS